MQDKDTNSHPQPSSKSPRLHYLDWLRLLATLGVFLYHAARPFDLQDYMIKNPERSAAVTVFFVIFLGSWGMPLFFLMAGASSLFSLRRRTGRQFARERVRRLVIPFIVGSILLTPIQIYLSCLHKGSYEGPFLAFIPQFIESLPGPALSELFNPGIFISYGIHLWFLGFLFSFSLIALPVFLWLKKEAGKRFISRLVAFSEKRGGLLIFIIPVMLVRLILQPLYPEYTSWSDFTYFLVFFVYGYVLYADERFVRVIKRDWLLLLSVGILSTIAIFTAVAAGAGMEWYSNPSIPGFYIAWSLISVNAWCWVIAALYVGSRILDFRNNVLEYGQEAILPFYVFHQPIIFVIVFYVVQWDAGIMVKLSLVILSAFVITGALHEFLIKRIAPLRIIFGMKPKTTTA
ncbi:MAG: acyltransferase family protein [Anaerolineales bacterium]|nr:acyltransferase family protein [Anaerolineales bacterium]